MSEEINLVSRSIRRRLKLCLGEHPSSADVPRILSVLANDSIGFDVKFAAKLELSRRYYLGIKDALKKLQTVTDFKNTGRALFSVNERALYDPLEGFVDEESKKQMSWHFKRADLWIALQCNIEMAVPWLSLSLHHMHFDFPYGSMALLGEEAKDFQFSESLYTQFQRDTVYVGFKRIAETVRERPSSHSFYQSRWSFVVNPKETMCFNCEHRHEKKDQDGFVNCPGSSGFTHITSLFSSVNRYGCHAYRSESTTVELTHVMSPG